MDQATIELIAERAAQRAIEKHEEKNQDQLKNVLLEVDKKIECHELRCPVGLDYKLCKARLWGFSLGIASMSSLLTVLLTKLVGMI